ncbi:hypothetical protein ACTM96_08755 [Mediterraneibacter faecis]|uniref:hypothetical protein n=1 Tax=Mediterraneibacter faecis TaxID=592978 RepID=UPI003F88E169
MRSKKSHARGTGCISKFKSNACECNRERLEKLLQEVFMGNLNLVIRKANRM